MTTLLILFAFIGAIITSIVAYLIMALILATIHAKLEHQNQEKINWPLYDEYKIFAASAPALWKPTHANNRPKYSLPNIFDIY